MRLLIALLVLGSFFPTATLADQASLTFGGDTYAAGQTTTINAPVEHDAFAAVGQHVGQRVRHGGEKQERRSH